MNVETSDHFEQARGDEAQAAEETLSAQMVGAYNWQLLTSPAMDRL